MSLLPKPSTLHAFQVTLFDATLPQDFLYPRGRRALSNHEYLIESLVMSGAHALRFDFKDQSIVELVNEHDRVVPLQHRVVSFSCPQEKDYEHRFSNWGLVYMTSVQTETLPESLYRETYEELMDFGRQNGALVHLWKNEEGPCLSMVDLQKYNGQAHAQSYHMVATGGLVLRTQTIFELS